MSARDPQDPNLLIEPQAGVDHDVQGRVVLTFYVDVVANDVVRVVLDPGQAAELMGSLVRQTTYALTDAVQNIKIGGLRDVQEHAAGQDHPQRPAVG